MLFKRLFCQNIKQSGKRNAKPRGAVILFIPNLVERLLDQREREKEFKFAGIGGQKQRCVSGANIRFKKRA